MEPAAILAPALALRLRPRAGGRRRAPAQRLRALARTHRRRQPHRPAHRAAQPPRLRGAARAGARARLRGDRPMSVVVGDIDCFRQVNEQHGHAAGDEALQSVARNALKWKRRIDVAARIARRGVRAAAPGDGRARRLHRRRAPAPRRASELRRDHGRREVQLRRGHRAGPRQRRRRRSCARPTGASPPPRTSAAIARSSTATRSPARSTRAARPAPSCSWPP